MVHFLVLMVGFGQGVSAWAGPVEFQIFLNYRGSNRYDAKVVSDWDYVVNAALVHFEPGERPSNAVCYKGSPIEAAQLFEAMVEQMNDRSSRPVQVSVQVIKSRAPNGPYLRVLEFDGYGGKHMWFSKIRECVRWSTPMERKN